MWSLNHPDIVSGWNTNWFDIPYLINRFNKIVGEQETKKLSPWGVVQQKTVRKYNERFAKYEEETTYNNFYKIGISNKWYPNGQLESEEEYGPYEKLNGLKRVFNKSF